MSDKTEEPPYVVIRTLEEGVEIRKYDTQIRASSKTGQENRSFGILAEYIFGGNEGGEKIGMTAPVVTYRERMSFIMPNRYQLESLPKPLNDHVEIEVVDGAEVAVLRFSGFASPEATNKKTEELLKILKSNGIRIRGSPFLMRYNPPWTLPFLRRNEVAVEVESKL
jgi:hypothetical protein